MKVFLWIAGVLLFFLSWGGGSGSCSYDELFLLLSGREIPETARTILLEIRLPRLLAAFLTGSMLASSGAAAQNIFRNDLASPHVLGIIHAAALGAVCSIVFPVPAVAGAFLLSAASLFLIFVPGTKSSWDGAVLLLAGIAVNAFASSLTSGVLYLADEKLSSVVFWLLGGFWRIGWNEVILLAAVFLCGSFVLWKYSPEMDVFLLGDRSAELGGVPLKKLKPYLLLVISVMTAACVSCCGVIGFVGLAVPHIVRFFSGAKFSSLLPGCIISGGGFLLLADLVSRTVFPPHEIPVGILTSALGGPFFFMLLLRRRKKYD